jgi:hypothetical protein
MGDEKIELKEEQAPKQVQAHVKGQLPLRRRSKY